MAEGGGNARGHKPSPCAAREATGQISINAQGHACMLRWGQSEAQYYPPPGVISHFDVDDRPLPVFPRNTFLNMVQKAKARLAKGSRAYFPRKKATPGRQAMVDRFRAYMPTAAQKGHLQTSGYYGRFSGPSAELKFHDVDLDDALIAQAGTITGTINIIAQDVTEKTRVGRKCTIMAINWRYDIVLNDTGTANTTAESVRVIMYLDKQTNGAPATALEILETDDYQSFNNLANKSRFMILLDRQHDLSATSGSGQNAADVFGEVIQSGTFFKKVNIPIEYDNSASTGAITTIRSNNIGVLLLAKDGNLCTFASKIRLRFSDM